ncbi:SIMPL domain-containing protein [Ostreiculturibacter nitratireducens]|uniref:SIMPL domain-containing protein n=1 Tax=Ostreiculturibacter nitratireducens TaxID=3075226 RepID=UPI0031B603D4
MRISKLFMIILAVPLALAVPAQAETDARHITVTGEGQVAATPDMAQISLGVTTEAESAAAALAANSEEMARVLAFLKAEGIEDRDLQTTGLSLYPLYEDSERAGRRAPQIVGFTASNSLTIRVRALDRLGGLLDAVVGEGANTLNGLSFGLQDPADQLDEARRRAVADARRRAEILATAAGVTLGPVVSMTEQSGYPMPMAMEASFAKAAPVPVAAGEMTVTANVTMIFAIGE